jgi:ribosome maturation factor RimP
MNSLSLELQTTMGVSSDPAMDARFIREVGLASQVAGLVEPVLEELGFRLVRVKASMRDGATLQIMAERSDGTITVEECAEISRNLSAVLDVHDPIPDGYHLEISSPGIDRPLVRPSDFETWAGYEARIELKEPVSGRKRFRGRIDGFADGEVRLETDLAADELEKGSPATRHVIGLPIALLSDAKLVLTDDLIREALDRAKKAREGKSDGAIIDGGDAPDIDGILPEQSGAQNKPRRKDRKANRTN